jgi:NAD+ synthase (glutamine-hydrolysing)
VAVLAADALGPAHVTGVAIPSRYTDPRSTSGAEALARALGIGFEVVELAPLHAAAEASLASLLVAGGTVAENVQARLRMVILMAFVNRYGGMLLNTSNKTELAVGYGTLYGDLAGTLSPIGDLTKPDVYALARWIQASRSPSSNPTRSIPSTIPSSHRCWSASCRATAAIPPCGAPSTSAGTWASS